MLEYRIDNINASFQLKKAVVTIGFLFEIFNFTCDAQNANTICVKNLLKKTLCKDIYVYLNFINKKKHCLTNGCSQQLRVVDSRDQGRDAVLMASQINHTSNEKKCIDKLTKQANWRR